VDLSSGEISGHNENYLSGDIGTFPLFPAIMITSFIWGSWPSYVRSRDPFGI